MYLYYHVLTFCSSAPVIAYNMVCTLKCNHDMFTLSKQKYMYTDCTINLDQTATIKRCSIAISSAGQKLMGYYSLRHCWPSTKLSVQ